MKNFITVICLTMFLVAPSAVQAQDPPPPTLFSDSWPQGLRMDISDSRTVLALSWPRPDGGRHCTVFDFANVSNLPGVMERLGDAIDAYAPGTAFIDWVRTNWDIVWNVRALDPSSVGAGMCAVLNSNYVEVP